MRTAVHCCSDWSLRERCTPPILPGRATMRPDGRGTVEIGQKVRFVYPYKKDLESKFSCLVIGDKSSASRK